MKLHVRERRFVAHNGCYDVYVLEFIKTVNHRLAWINKKRNNKPTYKHKKEL